MSDKSFDSKNSLEYEQDEKTRNTSDKENERNNELDELNLKNINIINSITEILIGLLEKNKKLGNYKEIIKLQNKMAFSANSIPKISIYNYLIRIQKYSEVEKSTLILSLILIDNICKNANIILTYYNIHRILFGAILISIKINEDSYYNNEYYAQIAGVKLKELNLIEYSFLKLNNFNVYINEKEYEQYKNYLEEPNKMKIISKIGI